MKTIQFIQPLFFISVLHFFGCSPKVIPHTGSHTVIILELDTLGFYKEPGKCNPANIRYLAKVDVSVIRRRLIKAGIAEGYFELKDTNAQITFKLWHPEELKVSKESIRKLLQSDAKLGFWETFTAKEAMAVLFPDTYASDATNADSLHREFLSLLMIDITLFKNIDDATPQLGYAAPGDRERIDTLLKQCKPPVNMHFLWSTIPNSSSGKYALYVLKGNKPFLSNDAIEDAYTVDENNNSFTSIEIKMNPYGANNWKIFTKKNIGNNIAITLDNMVCTAPRVTAEIPGGISEISGSFSRTEAKELAAMLAAGSMPIDVHIVEEKIEN